MVTRSHPTRCFAACITTFLGVTISSLCSVAPVQAQLLDRDDAASLSIGGYLRSLTGYRDLGYETGVGDRRSGFNGEVVRIKWLLQVSDNVRVSMHNRLQTRWSSSSLMTNGSVLGFGVSAVPSRTVDLEQILIDRDKVRLWHDIDRLSLTGYFDIADVTVGRQAVTWGVSSLFPVADLWAQFSPFELDTEEKPGLDALRVLMYPASGVEFDIVVGDRGTVRDLSAGGRVTVQLPVGDVYGGVGKFWRQIMAMTGASFVVESWKIRGEVAVPWDIDEEEFGALRATVGADWISSEVQLTAEYHFNGLGAGTSAGYLQRLVSPPVARGESYYLGRHYVGLALSHLATDRLTLALSGLSNLQDPSFAWTPVFNYDLGQNMRISAGGLLSVGQTPRFDGFALTRFESEFGSYGRFAYAQVSLYF